MKRVDDMMFFPTTYDDALLIQSFGAIPQVEKATSPECGFRSFRADEKELLEKVLQVVATMDTTDRAATSNKPVSS
jgi:hypothetical protein